MKIALAQLNYHIGNFENNALKIKESVCRAKEKSADLIIFAELCVCGYPPRDFLEFNDFIERCDKAVNLIAKECHGIAAIVGMPTFNHNKKGKKLYNSAVFITEGKVSAVRHKSLLPNYDVFDEYRYFEQNKDFRLVEYKGYKIALTICEDIWNIEDMQLYTVCPMDELISKHPDFIINIAASPFHYEQEKIRKDILTRNAKKYNLPLFYVNHVGAQTELIFDGGSMVISKNGKIADELKYFEEDFRIYDLKEIQNNKTKQFKIKKWDKVEKIHYALVLGIKNYFEKLGFKKGIIGLSGGIDSAVTLVLAVKALGKQNVKAILMPSKFSTEHSVKDAKELCNNLGVDYELISIEKAYDGFINTLNPYFKNLPFDITEENLQARIRGVILMAFTNKFSYILLNTSNKSEIAVGYGTLYGDMCGGLSVLGDVYKTEVYKLADYINKGGKIIPDNIITKAPSAELRPGQKDSDSIPEYEILDKILYQYIELSRSPMEIIGSGFDKNTVKKILRLVNISEHKRYQSPPILRVSPKAFGSGRRMPIVSKYLD